MTGPDPNPSGLCQCGCGKRTKRAKRTRASRGVFKGNHLRYADGHGPSITGQASHKWKGGRRINGYGYIEIYKPEHPYCSRDKYVLEHRLVMEKKLGRYLLPEERVHHINRKKTDNRIKNLSIVNRSEHAKIHVKPLLKWTKKHPRKAKKASSAGGKKGAAARWGKS